MVVGDEQIFSKFLTQQMQAAGWSSIQLGERITYSASYIRKIQAGDRKPSRKFCEEISQLFNLSRKQVLMLAGYEAVSSDVVSEELLQVAERLSPENIKLWLKVGQALADQQESVWIKQMRCPREIPPELDGADKN